MPTFAIFDWSMYTTTLSQTDLETSTHGNDPGQTGSNPYNPGVATWTGVDFTYNGGDPTVIEINDDDGDFEDGYVETGGAQTLASDVTIDGTTYYAGDVVELEFSLVDASGNEVYVVRIDGVNVGFAYSTGENPQTGETFVADDTRDGDPLDSLDQTTGSEEPYPNLLCFAAGTRIATAAGDRRVDTIEVGDLVATLDHGFQPVRLINRSRYTWSKEQRRKKPVEIQAGALGAGLPVRNLIVSAQHRMMIPEADLTGAALCPARALTVLPGIRQLRGLRQVELVHLMFDRHEVLLAEGAPAESFWPGPAAMATLNWTARVRVHHVIAATGREFLPARKLLLEKEGRARFSGGGPVWTPEALRLLALATAAAAEPEARSSAA